MIKTESKGEPRVADPEDKYAIPTEASVGEKAFGAATYTGVGYFANLIMSVMLWDSFRNGHLKGIPKPLSNGLASLVKGVTKDEAAAQKVATTLIDYGLSTTGGHIAMVPLVMMEDKARYITHEANKLLDKDYKYKDVKASWSTPDRELPPLLNEPTEQNIPQVVLRRAIGMGIIAASGTTLERVKLARPLENATVNLFNNAIKATGSKTLKNVSEIPRMQRYIKLTGLDAYFTVITATVAYMTSNLFGKKQGSNELPAKKTEAPEAVTREAPVLATTPTDALTVAEVKPNTLLKAYNPDNMAAHMPHASHTERLAAQNASMDAARVPA